MPPVEEPKYASSLDLRQSLPQDRSMDKNPDWWAKIDGNYNVLSQECLTGQRKPPTVTSTAAPHLPTEIGGNRWRAAMKFLDSRNFPTRPRSFKIFRPGIGAPYLFVPWDKMPCAIWEHWWEGRTLPCDEQDGVCPACAAGRVPRLASYTCVRDEASGNLVILSLPYTGTVSLFSIARSLDDDLSGWTIAVKRAGRTKRSACRVIHVASSPRIPIPRGSRPNTKAVLQSIFSV